jgi:hypothetical protein
MMIRPSVSPGFVKYEQGVQEGSGILVTVVPQQQKMEVQNLGFSRNTLLDWIQ